MRDRYSTNHRQARPLKEPEGIPSAERPTTDAAADDTTPSIPAMAVGNIRSTTPPRVSNSPQSHAHSARPCCSRGREHDRPASPYGSPSTRRRPIARLRYLKALSPTYALDFFVNHFSVAFFALAAVVLAVTGAEALYADMGHFGRAPITRAWLLLVFPACVLSYAGRGAC